MVYQRAPTVICGSSMSLSIPRDLGSLQGKSQTNLPIARQRLEMRDSLCCATLVAAHACSKHVLEPLRASAER